MRTYQELQRFRLARCQQRFAGLDDPHNAPKPANYQTSNDILEPGSLFIVKRIRAWMEIAVSFSDAEYCRLQAFRCRRLAMSAEEPTASLLAEMADSYEAKARELDPR